MARGRYWKVTNSVTLLVRHDLTKTNTNYSRIMSQIQSSQSSKIVLSIENVPHIRYRYAIFFIFVEANVPLKVEQLMGEAVLNLAV